VAVPLFFHEGKRKLASGSTEAAQCSYQEEAISAGKYISKPSAIQNVRLAGSRVAFDQRLSFEPATAKCTFWIAEGLLMYFPAEIASSLIRTLSSLSAPGSQLAFTSWKNSGRPHSIRFSTKLVTWWLHRRGEPFLWGTTRNELAEFIRPWRVIRFFDHNDLRDTESDLSGQIIAKGEAICLAAI